MIWQTASGELREGEPCSHLNCLGHLTHPCEGCGRIGGKWRPRIITICGSSRFCAEMAIFMWQLEKGGAICLGLHLLPMEYAECEDHLAEKEGVAAQMDELHLRKIDLCDEVFVMDIGGYIGESTRREIEYAKAHGKPVLFYSKM